MSGITPMDEEERIECYDCFTSNEDVQPSEYDKVMRCKKCEGKRAQDDPDGLNSKYYKDDFGNWYMEIVSRKYGWLHDLQKAHESRKRKTWLNLYDAVKGMWCLTIQTEVK